MTYCRSGSSCAGRVDRIPAEVNADGVYCLACLQRTATRIRSLPAQYGQLQLLLHITHHGDPGPTHSTPGPIVPLNCHIDALLRDIDYLLAQTGEIVADMLGVEDPPHLPGAAELVAEHLHHLAELAPWPIVVWTRSGTWRKITSSAGIHLVARLDRLARLATTALGGTRARTRRDLPCSRCGAKTIGRWAGSDYYDCTTCGSRFHLNDIRRQDKILVELHKRGRLKV